MYLKQDRNSKSKMQYEEMESIENWHILDMVRDQTYQLLNQIGKKLIPVIQNQWNCDISDIEIIPSIKHLNDQLEGHIEIKVPLPFNEYRIWLRFSKYLYILETNLPIHLLSHFSEEFEDYTRLGRQWLEYP